MKVTFDRIRLGNGRRTAPGWLINANGAVRGIMSGDSDGRLHFGFACDRRIAPEDGYMCFRDLAEARAWIAPRLTTSAERLQPVGPAHPPKPWPRGR